MARPIIAADVYNPGTGERNDSLRGDFLWSNVNFGEAIPDVMTPFTASALELGPMARMIKFSGESAHGNICGRPYLNISVFASIFHAVGKSHQQTIELLDGVANLPVGTDIPLIPASRLALFPALAQLLAFQWRQGRDLKRMPSLVADNRLWCNAVRRQLGEAHGAAELLALWEGRIKPHLILVWYGLLSSARHHADYTSALQRELVNMVGPADADALLSGMSGDGQTLASLGPLLGLESVRQGQLSPIDYLDSYGHRGPHELELASPRPAEEPDWLERQQASSNVTQLLTEQKGRSEAAWGRFRRSWPDQEKSMGLRIAEVARRARLREDVRSEYVRVFGIWRHWALQAGRVAGLEQDVFFLTVDETLGLLRGDRGPVRYIEERRLTHTRYQELSPYPPLIRGRFTPQPSPSESNPGSASIHGVAGCAGVAEGVVRCLSSPEEGELQVGEILVTAYTNVGWTFLFPRAAAIVTDVGANLSHAAIVARELGIPAVVGCGNATARLRTGVRVRVDGARGCVDILP